MRAAGLPRLAVAARDRGFAAGADRRNSRVPCFEPRRSRIERRPCLIAVSRSPPYLSSKMKLALAYFERTCFTNAT